MNNKDLTIMVACTVLSWAITSTVRVAMVKKGMVKSFWLPGRIAKPGTFGGDSK